MNNATIEEKSCQGWEIDSKVFNEWIKGKTDELKNGLKPQPTIKVLIFLALLEVKKPCSYEELKNIFFTKKIVIGNVPDNTLRTSILNLSRTLDRFSHYYELKSLRGQFQLLVRNFSSRVTAFEAQQNPLMINIPAIKPEVIAINLIEKARLPFSALYFLEWSARWWEIFSHDEAQIRVNYESEAWNKLAIKNRILSNTNEIISFVALAPGEGLAEIELLKKILNENPAKKIHYLAIDSSQRLLREHLNLLKEALAKDIDNHRLICAGITADIFADLSTAIKNIRQELVYLKRFQQHNDFLPEASSLLVTYLGNCLGNCYQDQETDIFSLIYSHFANRPLEILVGVSVMRAKPDVYKRNWDDFLLQTPKHLLETNKLLVSSRFDDSEFLPEFHLSTTDNRCPSVMPEAYYARHGIEGQIYRFYYRLQYDLQLSPELALNVHLLPKGSLLLLYNIIKYDIVTLVNGIKKCGLFDVKYDPTYHQIIDTKNGIREYAIFSAYISQ